MRIPVWPGVRLCVWERQNPEAVKVTLARSKPYEPVRRVLSMRGWMLLWVRYDWKDYSPPEPEDPAKSPVVYALTRELHRRNTHLQTIRAASEGLVLTDQWVMTTGEVQGLQGALGIALGGKVAGGTADELAQGHYRSWVAANACDRARCHCDLCVRILAGEGQR
ncbi:hypothetical protein [Streptomyces sp. NBC_00878]|uniref:hypothetical protein n=1 Tax=Streptomyces sp. NBC_00878 TaxID=2975854 RepID=UPI002250F3F1|nr:hypothetical protein [Streptomyces sp. NBC_00878]MCX4911863.1 hypothetical protein [Streptomyces sp. NBC_00878]